MVRDQRGGVGSDGMGMGVDVREPVIIGGATRTRKVHISEKSGRTRALRWFPDIGPCVRCGAEKSERHHKDGNTANNAQDNIEALCRRCHMEADGRLQAQRESAPLRQGKACELAATWRLSRTHCLRGHEFTAENTRINKSGARVCRACAPLHKAAYAARKAIRDA